MTTLTTVLYGILIALLAALLASTYSDGDKREKRFFRSGFLIGLAGGALLAWAHPF